MTTYYPMGNSLGGLFGGGSSAQSQGIQTNAWGNPHLNSALANAQNQIYAGQLQQSMQQTKEILAANIFGSLYEPPTSLSVPKEAIGIVFVHFTGEDSPTALWVYDAEKPYASAEKEGEKRKRGFIPVGPVLRFPR